MDEPTKATLPSGTPETLKPALSKEQLEAPEPKAVSEQTPGKSERESKPEKTEGKQPNDVSRRLAALEEENRKIQAAKDREVAQARREARERIARERAQFEAILRQTGAADDSQIEQVRRQYSQDDEIEELRQQAALGQAYHMQEQARQYREKYTTARAQAAGVDPNDPRLDKGSPQAFDLSLIKVVKEDLVKSVRGKANEAAGEDEERKRLARQDLDVLGGGGGVSSPDELPEDSTELWSLAQKSGFRKARK